MTRQPSKRAWIIAIIILSGFLWLQFGVAHALRYAVAVGLVMTWIRWRERRKERP